jgi:hypothetical protein
MTISPAGTFTLSYTVQLIYIKSIGMERKLLPQQATSTLASLYFFDV